MKTFLSLALIIVSILGIFDAGYISYEELSGGQVLCGAGFDCGKVLNSPWSHVGPLPLATLGLVYYVFILTLSCIHFLELDLSQLIPALKLKNHHLLLLFTSFGFLFSLYLVFLMGVIIKAWCFYCLMSALSSSLLFILSLALGRTYAKNNQ